MTDVQRHTLRSSEVRERLNELATRDEALSDEERAEVSTLRTELRDVETKLRAAIEAEAAAPETEPAAEPTGESRERAELRNRASVGAIFASAFERRNTEGAERELQAELSLSPNQVPLELLRLPVESRAVTPAPTNTGAIEQPVVTPVFADGDAAFLGVDMPTVPSGDAVFPVLTTRPTVGHKATDNNDAVAETTGAFSAEVLKPGRMQASFFYRRTDAARFAGMDMALRQALTEGLSEANDAQMLAQIVADVSQTDTSGQETFANYRARMLYAHVDGRYASMASAVRILAGSATYAHMAAAYRANESDMNALGALMAESGGVRVSPHIAAVASKKQDVIVRRGSRRDAVAATWEGVTLIPDEVTKASTGEIVITAVALVARKVIRTAGFARVAAQVQA